MPKSPVEVINALNAFEPYSSGLSIDEIREKYGLDRVVKLASNENPLGLSPLAEEAMRRECSLAFRYVQSGTPRLVRAVAEACRVPEQTVVLGNGSDEVIDLLIRARCKSGVDNIVVNNPCFSIYCSQAKFCGVETRRVPLKPDFSFDWGALLRAVDGNTSLVFVTTPDNPTGYCPPVTEVEAFARALPGGVLLVVDEAYMAFAEDVAPYSLLPRRHEFPNVAFIRTFSKLHGLAGARLGYGIMPEPLAQKICGARLPFSVNCLVEAGALAALQDVDFVRASLDTVREGREYLTTLLCGLGCTVPDSLANFIMFRLPESATVTAPELFERLLRRGLIIRPLKSYGLSEWLRVSIGSHDENRLFIKLLQEELEL